MKKKFAGFALFGFLVLMMFVSSSWAETKVNAETTPDGKYEYSNDGLGRGVRITGYFGNETDLTIPNKIDGKSVTGIGTKAFSYCTSIKHVTIPNSVKHIDVNAFSDCYFLESVTIPNSVTEIGWGVFTNCTSLSSVVIPDGVTSVSNNMFNDCSALKSVKIPDSVTSIDGSAFDGCSSLTNIEIPNSVTSIEYSAFSGCSSLKSIEIPKGVKNIDHNTFYKCSSLTSVTIPDSVVSIGDRTFSYCSSLTNVTIPDSVTSIGGWAFSQCSSLTNVTIPDSVVSIGERVFSGCSSLKSANIPGGVVNMGDSMFSNCTSLTNITISKGITNIGNWTFYKCSSLTSITIPNSVTSIGVRAFSDCSSLTSVTIPDSVTSIGKQAFSDCSSLKNIEIPEGVITINNSTFENCGALTSIKIPDSVTSIGERAFRYCSSLESVNLPDGVTSIGEQAFSYCSSLKNANLPDSVADMGDNVFYDCTSLTGVTIPKNVTSIGEYVFWDCDSLISITIPESVTTIGNHAFSSCDSLVSITIPDSVTFIDDGAFRYTYTTIYGKPGSYVETYAQNNNIKFEAVGKESYEITGVQIAGRAGDALRINWDKNSWVSGYILEQYKNGKWERIARIGKNTTTTYRVAKLSPGTSYQFRICGFAFDGSTPIYGDYTEVTGKTNPSVMTGVKIGGRAGNALRLNWTKNPTAAGYIIEQYQSGKWVRIAQISGNATTTYRVGNLSPLTTYKFRIQAFNYDGKTAIYGGYAYVNGKTNPSIMTGVKIGGRAADALRINWTKNPTAAGYIIEQYKSGKWVRIARISGNTTTTYRVEKLSPLTTYQFRIRAFNYDGKTAIYGNYAYVNGKTNPSIMTGVKIGGTAKDALRINWTKNPTAAGYIIEQYQSGKWVRIAKISNNATTTYRVEKLSPSTTYQFRIRAFNFDGSTALYGNYAYVDGQTLK